MPNYHLKDSINNILKKVYSKKSEEFSEIAINWHKIIGDEFVDLLTPLGIRYFKTKDGQQRHFIVKLNDNSKLIQIEFSKEILMERINKYLGFKAITDIKLK